MSSEEIINRYNRAFVKLHDRSPYIKKRGAWIYVDDSSALRIKDLRRMTEVLEARIEERENIHQETTDRDFFTTEYLKKRKWQEQISNNITMMFLDELYNRCGSSFNMERFMRNFSCGDDISSLKFNEDDDESETYRDYIYEIEELQEECYHLKKEYDKIEKKLKISEKISEINLKTKDEWKEKYEELKRNSVLFSMEELNSVQMEFTPDDDIPF